MVRNFGEDDLLWEFTMDDSVGDELSDVPADYKEKMEKYFRVAFDNLLRPDPLQELRSRLIQLALVLDFAKEYDKLTPAVADSLLHDTTTRPLSPHEEMEITEELGRTIDDGDIDIPTDSGDFEQFLSSLTDKL